MDFRRSREFVGACAFSVMPFCRVATVADSLRTLEMVSGRHRRGRPADDCIREFLAMEQTMHP